eukprot:TRINITY_DN826_c0_g1_i1.p2 TRINITY_DN826_c0_g1~~TRINITY_DN826_c0_g1_i1.p2  ORF type:complete len:272 (-),score=79.41 TRINITY_DN826_c0_g1_i1:345-1160(-)
MTFLHVAPQGPAKPFTSEEAAYFQDKVYGKPKAATEPEWHRDRKLRELYKHKQTLIDALDRPMATQTVDFWKAVQGLHKELEFQNEGASVTATGILRKFPPTADQVSSWSQEDVSRVQLPQTLDKERIAQFGSFVRAHHPRKDGNFPYTNQARNCFFSYASFKDCMRRHDNQMVDGPAEEQVTPACLRLAHRVSFLCPTKWQQQWDNEIEEGVFPNPAWLNEGVPIPIDEQRVHELLRFTQPHEVNWGRARVDEHIRSVVGNMAKDFDPQA